MEKLLTIVFPSFNRGARLLETITLIKDEVPHFVDILVLDNASDRDKESYEKLSEIAENEPWLTYIRHEQNRHFHGNFLAGFEFCSSDYLMFMSDEDLPNFDFAVQNSRIFKDKNAFGAIRPSIGCTENGPTANACPYADKSYVKGPEAISQFGLTGNYLSGVIYNKYLISKYRLDERLRLNLEKNKIYPHLYLNSLLSAVTNTCFMSAPSAFVGEAIVVEDNGNSWNNASQYREPYSFGSRLDQFIILKDAFEEGLQMVPNATQADWLTCYINLVNKFFNLIILANGPMYHNSAKLNIFDISNSFKSFVMSAYKRNSLPREYDPIFMSHVEDIEKSCLSKLTSK